MPLSVDNLLWLAATLSEIFVIALLFKRQVWRTLPVFCSYCVWDLLSNLVVFAVGQLHPVVWNDLYFAQTVLDSIFVFCVLVELLWSVLRPVRASLPRSALIVVGLIILIAGVAIWPFAAPPSPAHATVREGLLLVELQHTVSILRILVFLLLAAGSQLLSMSWRDRELQVATGLGFYSIVSVAVSVLQTHQATFSQILYLNQFVVASYVCSLLYWVVSFAHKEAERKQFTPQMRNFLLAAAGAARTTRVAMNETINEKPPKRDDR